jgi:hypothetical protein
LCEDRAQLGGQSNNAVVISRMSRHENRGTFAVNTLASEIEGVADYFKIW